MRTIEGGVEPGPVLVVEIIALFHGQEIDNRAFRQVDWLVKYQPAGFHGRS